MALCVGPGERAGSYPQINSMLASVPPEQREQLIVDIDKFLTTEDEGKTRNSTKEERTLRYFYHCVEETCDVKFLLIGRLLDSQDKKELMDKTALLINGLINYLGGESVKGNKTITPMDKYKLIIIASSTDYKNCQDINEQVVKFDQLDYYDKENRINLVTALSKFHLNERKTIVELIQGEYSIKLKLNLLSELAKIPHEERAPLASLTQKLSKNLYYFTEILTTISTIPLNQRNVVVDKAALLEGIPPEEISTALRAIHQTIITADTKEQPVLTY